MSNTTIKKHRNVRNQFFYLLYPTFIIKIFYKDRYYYKCFICSKLFKNKYSLSRHLYFTKCLKQKSNNFYSKSKFNHFAEPIKNILTIANPSLRSFEKDFINKKKEPSSFYNYDTFNNNINKDNLGFNADTINFFKNHINYNPSELLLSEKNVLGEGHFGKVYCSTYKNQSSLVAVKLTKNNLKEAINEINLLNCLININGVPKVIDFLTNNNKSMIIENLCGPSLDKLHWFCSNKFNEYTIIKIAINIINILKEVHNYGIIHRDLKPGKICYGIFSKDNNKLIKSLNIIDFGLAKKYSYNYSDEESKKRPGYFVGTMIFGSNSTLEGIEQQPKDDLESPFYVLLYLQTGTLPWLHFKSKDKYKYINNILQKRKEVPIKEMFAGFTEEVIFIYKSILNLSLNEKPNYEIYVQILEQALYKYRINYKIEEVKFEWETKFEELNKGFKNLKVNLYDLKKVEFLKTGYSLDLEKFLRLFG